MSVWIQNERHKGGRTNLHAVWVQLARGIDTTRALDLEQAAFECEKLVVDG
jgi:hypothetical protein